VIRGSNSLITSINLVLQPVPHYWTSQMRNTPYEKLKQRMLG
jgi:hypothetical protein